jgi:hypothetical protein
MNNEHLAGTKGETVNQAHTPLPWAYGCPDKKTHYIMVGGHTEIANLPHCRAISESSYAIENFSEREANAKLIVTAVNSHAANLARIKELEGILRRVKTAMNDPDDDSPFGLDELETSIDNALKGTK